MSTNFFFKSFEVSNYRVFRHFKVESFKRINILSGVNGSGKTALIESLFLSVDLANPTCLLRPLAWRGIPLTGEDLALLFPNKNQNSYLKVQTAKGLMSIDLKYGQPDDKVLMNVSRDVRPDAREALTKISATNSEGVTLKAVLGGSKVPTHLFYTQSGASVDVAGQLDRQLQFPRAVYLAQFLQNSSKETADRVSQIIRRGKKSTLLKHVQILNSEITNIEVLQDSGNAQLYVVIDEKYTPLSLMGGGLRALVEIISCVMVSPNGIVMIDELDSALHFSIVPALWEVIAEIAHQENVQIFAITHSRETIHATAVGVSRANRDADFQYLRVDEFEDEHRCTSYSIDELADAEEMNVEIR